MTEMKIDVVDLLKKCLNKWKFLLICMLVGGVLLDAAGYVKSVKNANAIAEQMKESDEDSKDALISEYMQILSKRERVEVETAVSSYKEYQQEYADSLNYYQNSVRMKLNPGSVPTLTMQYIVDTHYEVVYPTITKKDNTKDIINTFAGKIMSEDVGNAIAKALGMEENAGYTQELVNAGYTENSLLTFTIIGNSREQCETIAQIIKDNVEKDKSEVSAVYGAFDITLASEQYYEEADDTLMKDQQQMVTSLNGLKSSMLNLTSGMTDSQKLYYFALLDSSVDNGLEEDNTSAELTELVVPEVEYINFKYIIGGFLLGIICGCGWIAFIYIFGGKLRIAKDMEALYGVSVLGNLSDKKNNKLIKNSYEFLNEEERLQMIIAGIQITAKKEHMHNIFVTGTATTEKSVSACKKIRDLVEEKGLSCEMGKTVLYDPRSVEQMANADGVVFVEQISVSKYDEMTREKTLSEKYQVPVVGCVIVE